MFCTPFGVIRLFQWRLLALNFANQYTPCYDEQLFADIDLAKQLLIVYDLLHVSLQQIQSSKIVFIAKDCLSWNIRASCCFPYYVFPIKLPMIHHFKNFPKWYFGAITNPFESLHTELKYLLQKLHIHIQVA